MSRQQRFFICALVLLALALTAPALAQTGSYAIESFTVDGGGGTSSGGSYALAGTIGQPEAGALAGGEFTLSGGFWGGAETPAVAQHHLYLPLVQRDGSQ